MKLGINGLGRIGKLSLWHHVSRKHFSELIVNIGRDVGSGLEDLAAAIERDSTYGSLGAYLYGHTGGRVIEQLDDARCLPEQLPRLFLQVPGYFEQKRDPVCLADMEHVLML